MEDILFRSLRVCLQFAVMDGNVGWINVSVCLIERLRTSYRLSLIELSILIDSFRYITKVSVSYYSGVLIWILCFCF
jgi:hypothetical protein